jgi:hypothetical protein
MTVTKPQQAAPPPTKRSSFNLARWREDSERPWPLRHPETAEEVEQLRDAERQIACTTGWNSSTMMIGRLLERLRSERDEA